ncbi:metal ABC transporter solute-binding protein, Zn/Mn family [Bacteroides caecigallinarum]|uniref:metal ABC transporter solute-binding protein, Zn/Mn family n=1 Tax=Bacteroides caecigallinarum TaxID=1411144 RepID=UPI00195A70EF|nr:zinc ABC transporter substrate-binding protein [Bacteroides caecigallinarum]MBM6883438.1 zinc ABC transporter substrate-binding protein [Bacteroides caecigallinarum]
MRTLLTLLILLLTVSCSNIKENEKPTITVTLEPLRYFTEAIAGDKFNIVSMVPEGNSPETYDPTPQQMVSLGKSVAYLRIGYIGFELAWIGKLQENLPTLKFYDTSTGVNLIHQQCSHSHSGETNEQHSQGIEPHIWNSTENAKIIAENIYKALNELDSKNSEYYQNRLDSLLGIIDETDNEIRSIISNSNKTFLIYHPALTYFAKDYGLEQISIEEGGKEPSPAHLQSLIKLCKEKNAEVIFVQQEFDMRNAETIANELNLKVILINPLNYNWKEEMIKTAKALCLQ